MNEYTTPKAGEHVIAYAYPSSNTARLLGQQERGCFVVHLVGEVFAHATCNGCIEHVTTLGTRPGRWSMDHPWNHHLYPHHDAIPEAQAWHRLLAGEEAQRAAAAERARALVAAGGRVSVTLDRTPLRTVVTETMHDVAHYVTKFGLADFFVQADSSGGSSTVLFKLPLDWPTDSLGPLPATST